MTAFCRPRLSAYLGRGLPAPETATDPLPSFGAVHCVQISSKVAINYEISCLHEANKFIQDVNARLPT